MIKPKAFNIEQLRCGSFRREGKHFDMVRFEDFIANAAQFRLPHRHNYYMVLLATSGSGQQLIDFQNYDIEAGQVFLMYPGQIHAWKNEKDLKGYLIFFTSEFFSLRYNNNNLHEFPFFQAGIQSPFIDLEEEQLQQLLTTAECMYREYREGQDDYLKVLRSFLNIFLVRCTRWHDVSQRRYTAADQNAALIVHNFQQLINQYYAEKHKVRDYAEILLITPNYLNAVCKKITGKSAGELIRDRIMLEAKRMLLHDKRTVAEIGHDLNFDDNSYFCRFFKKYEGHSPEKFRKQYQEVH